MKSLVDWGGGESHESGRKCVILGKNVVQTKQAFGVQIMVVFY